MFTTDFNKKIRNKLQSREYAISLTNEAIEIIRGQLEKLKEEEGNVDISTRIESTFVVRICF